MEFQRYLCFFLVFFSCLLCSSLANKFYVGGKDGWVSNPSEGFSHWAERNRFQVNDTLFFKYKKGSDSVLVVNKDDYYNCSKKNPVKKLKEGDSEFKFDRSGPFFFISGKDSNCEKGQKLIVNVLAVKRQSQQNPKAPAPAPKISHASPPQGSIISPAPAALPPKSQSPAAPVGPAASPFQKSPYPSPALPPKSPALAPGAPAPLSSGPSTGTPIISPLVPAIAPSISLPPGADTPTISPLVPAISPSISLPPGGETPTISPLVPAISPSISLPPKAETPELSPTSPSPSATSPELSPAPSSFSSPPSPPPESSSPSPSETKTPSQSPSGLTGTPGTPTSAPSGTPSDTIKSPSPSPSSAWVVTPSSLLLGSVTLVLSVAF